MQRVWAAVLSVWALLALVAVIAWARPPVMPGQPAGNTVVTKTVNGHRVAVVVQAPHTRTQTSPGAAQQQQQQLVVPGQAALVAPAGGGN
jgi:cyanate permease